MILEPEVPLHPHVGWQPPVVIGVIGGSGTRALTQIVSAAGVHMGTHLDAKTLDSLPIRELLTKGFEPLAGAAFAHGEALPRSLYQRLMQALELHRGTIAAGARWGWKNLHSLAT